MFYRCIFFVLFFMSKFELLGKNTSENQIALAIAGRRCEKRRMRKCFESIVVYLKSPRRRCEKENNQKLLWKASWKWKFLLKPYIKRFKLRSVKPFVPPLQIVWMLFFMTNCELLGKNPSENQTAIAIAGPLAHLTVHPLCVFLCMPLFDSPLEPYEAEPLLGKKSKNSENIL